MEPDPPVNIIVEALPFIVPTVAESVLAIVVVVEPKSVVAPALLNVRLLNVVFPVKVCVPVNALNVTVPLLCVNVPPLFVQFPPTLNIPEVEVKVPELSKKLPVRLIIGLFVLQAVVLPTVQLPPIASVPEAGVFVPAAEKIKC